MKKGIVILIMVLAAGCITSKRCFDKFPPEITYKVDTVKVIEYRDTIIEHYLPGDTVYAGERIVVINDTVVRVWRPVVANTELANAKAWIENDRLKLRLIQKDLIMRFKLDSAIRVSSDTIKITEVKVNTVEVEKPITKFISFWVLLGLWFLSMLVAALAIIKS